MAYYTKVIDVRETKLSTVRIIWHPIYCENKYDILWMPLEISDNHPNSGHLFQGVCCHMFHLIILLNKTLCHEISYCKRVVHVIVP